MSKVRASLIMVAAVLACLPISSTYAYVFAGSSWPSPRATFRVDIPGADGLWNTTFESALAQWSSDTVFAYSINHSYGDPCSDPNTSPYVNGVAFSTTFCGTPWGSGVVAVTGSWSQNGVTTQAGISFNSNYTWNVYSGSLQSNLDFRRVAVHELGHALGLGHESLQPSIMRASVGDTENPTADDIAGVHALYDGFVPLPFTFVDQGSVALSATITSAAVTITGITAPTAVSVTSGSYSIGCTGSFRSTASNISNNQSVCVRHTSAATPGTATSTVLRVGGISDTFTSTTSADTTPNGFSFADQTDVPLSSPITSSTVTITGINAPTPIRVTGGTFSIGCTASFTATDSTITNNQTVCVQHTSAATPSSATNTMLTVGTLSDTFTSTTAAAIDTDGDGIADSVDNCSTVANADQRDTDGDGYGSLCDADLDNNGFVNFSDLSLFKQRFGTSDADANLDGIGIVNFADLAIFKSLFGRAPGPSGLAP